VVDFMKDLVRIANCIGDSLESRRKPNQMEPKSKRQNERRSKYRFGMQRDLSYKMTVDGTLIASGTGKTINISSGGVAFYAKQQLTQGAFLEVSISWPVLLDQNCPMRVVIYGRVLRSTENQTVCSIDRYEFRTQARTFRPPAANRADDILLRWAEGTLKGNLKPPTAERSGVQSRSVDSHVRTAHLLRLASALTV
jgi:hypothetical protein